MDNQTFQRYEKELSGLTDTQLQAVKNILEFNLIGLLIGSKAEVALKLELVNSEIAKRA